MFWGLILKANKKYSQTVVKSFHLSQAALDLSKSGDDVQVMLTSEENTYLLCTLSKKLPQVALDLNFEEGDQISLSTNGEGIVHLTGYLIPNEEDIFGEEGDDEEVEDEDMEVSQPQKNKSGKERAAKKVAKKVIKDEVKQVQAGEDEEDELDETFELPKGAQKKQSGADSEESDSDDDDDDDDDDEEDEDDEMEEQAGEQDSDSDDDDEDEDDSDGESEDEEPAAKVAKVEKKPSKQNGLENGKASSKELKKDDKQKDEAKIRTLQGGLVVEDIKVGTGPEAKPGKKVVVYYEGRLKKNNKIFDSTSKGPGFKFALGRAEVIKGWDIGVAGMKVGGKRRLTVPHQLAYGTRGSPPVIPPNSTLVFDVELKNVH
ncbi:46 kDa FK506-binding nuclear protein [Malaya genurostris]|uniref:46 kDa FK506-binding nuclear protein n=1 Tax=Malaya genurostris TaxID=325434 RepID=UPI0026F39B24|nr:46 kDa FK506-binding nuclear protein [Malaya genurostris]